MDELRGFPAVQSTRLLQNFKEVRSEALHRPVEILFHRHASTVLVRVDTFEKMMKIILSDPDSADRFLELIQELGRADAFVQLVEERIKECGKDT